MKDTLRDECDDSEDCLENCCINQVRNNFFRKNIKKKHFDFSSDFGPSVLCGVCAAGPVCAGQCGGGCAHEAPGGDSQASQVWGSLPCAVLQPCLSTIQRKASEHGWQRFEQKKHENETGSDSENWDIFWLGSIHISIFKTFYYNSAHS